MPLRTRVFRRGLIRVIDGNRLTGQVIDDGEGLRGIVHLLVNTAQERIGDALRGDLLSLAGIRRITGESRLMRRATRRARGGQRRKQRRQEQQIRRT